MKSLGEKIKYYRNLNNWSQEQASEKLKISVRAYGRIERNETKLTYDKMVHFSKVFGITVSELVADDPAKYQDLKQQLAAKDKEINELQKKIIKLLEKKK